MQAIQRPFDGQPPRKRLKANELPLTQHQRNAIDTLAHTFKKRGEFDAIRKNSYASFEDGKAKDNFTTALTSFAEHELERNNALLGKDRRQAAPLIEGAAERSDVYKQAEEDVGRMIDEALAGAEDKLRDIRRETVGREVAAREQQNGSRTDEDYARDADVRREARAQQLEKELERQRQIEAEERRRQEEQKRKEREEEEARERQKAAERELERKQAEEREKARAEYKALKARQDAQWERERLEKEEKDRKKREAEKEKEIEQAALDELIRESKRAAERSARAEGQSSKEISRPSGSKESALAAIMRKERLEKERAKAGTNSRRSSDTRAGADEPERRRSESNGEPFGSPGGLVVKSTTSNVWVKDGQRKPKLGFSSTTIRPATPTGPSHGYQDEYHYRESRPRSHYNDEHATSIEYPEGGFTSHSRSHDPYSDRRTSYEADPRRSSIREARDEEARYEQEYYSSSRRSRHDESYDRSHDYEADYHRSNRSHHRERSRSRSPADYHRSSRQRRSSYRDPSPSASRNRRRSRSRDPKDIDRYVPSTSSRAKDYEPRPRPPPAIEREKQKPTEIDSYIPSTSIRARGRNKDQTRARSPSGDHTRGSRTARSDSRGSRR